MLFHPGLRVVPSAVTSAPTGQWVALLGHVCAPLPRWGLLLCDAGTWYLLQVKTHSQNHRYFYESPDDLNRHVTFELITFFALKGSPETYCRNPSIYLEPLPLLTLH